MEPYWGEVGHLLIIEPHLAGQIYKIFPNQKRTSRRWPFGLSLLGSAVSASRAVDIFTGDHGEDGDNGDGEHGAAKA